jgi:hypothetical protein
MEDVVWVLVPLMALAIPLTAVAGRVVVKPIVEAIAKLNATQVRAQEEDFPLEHRLVQTEERLAGMERLLERILEEQDFQRKLLAGRAGGAADPAERQ